jgi:hypothetical protein
MKKSMHSEIQALPKRKKRYITAINNELYIEAERLLMQTIPLNTRLIRTIKRTNVRSTGAARRAAIRQTGNATSPTSISGFVRDIGSSI